MVSAPMSIGAVAASVSGAGSVTGRFNRPSASRTMVTTGRTTVTDSTAMRPVTIDQGRSSSRASKVRKGVAWSRAASVVAPAEIRRAKRL